MKGREEKGKEKGRGEKCTSSLLSDVFNGEHGIHTTINIKH